jgi:hypothetical protein
MVCSLRFSFPFKYISYCSKELAYFHSFFRVPERPTHCQLRTVRSFTCNHRNVSTMLVSTVAWPLLIGETYSSFSTEVMPLKGKLMQYFFYHIFSLHSKKWKWAYQITSLCLPLITFESFGGFSWNLVGKYCHSSWPWQLIFNLVVSTIPEWRTFKILGWV